MHRSMVRCLCIDAYRWCTPLGEALIGAVRQCTSSTSVMKKLDVAFNDVAQNFEVEVFAAGFADVIRNACLSRLDLYIGEFFLPILHALQLGRIPETQPSFRDLEIAGKLTHAAVASLLEGICKNRHIQRFALVTNFDEGVVHAIADMLRSQSTVQTQSSTMEHLPSLQEIVRQYSNIHYHNPHQSYE